jgi:hypothetical protein
MDIVWIREVQVFPEKLKVSVGNRTGISKVARLQSRQVSIPVGGGEFELPFYSQEQPWNEFVPKMHELTVRLKAGKFGDSKTVVYALRDFSARDHQFILNGRATMLRGPVDECVYPLTGYPTDGQGELAACVGNLPILWLQFHAFSFLVPAGGGV